MRWEEYRVVKQFHTAMWRGTVTLREHKREKAIFKWVNHLTEDHQENPLLTREQEVLAQLDHPHIVRLLDTYVDPAEEDGHYLVLQYIGGSDLKVLNKKGRFPKEKLPFYLGHIASALHHMHAKGLVHRDVKPANIIIANDGATLIDLMLVVEEGHRERGVVSGTPNYMCADQWRGRAYAANDIFALGVVGCQIVGGKHPFARGTTIEDVAYQVRTKPLYVLPRSRENDMLMAMIEVKRRNRPSLEEVMEVFPCYDSAPVMPEEPQAPGVLTPPLYVPRNSPSLLRRLVSSISLRST